MYIDAVSLRSEGGRAFHLSHFPDVGALKRGPVCHTSFHMEGTSKMLRRMPHILPRGGGGGGADCALTNQLAGLRLVRVRGSLPQIVVRHDPNPNPNRE